MLQKMQIRLALGEHERPGWDLKSYVDVLNFESQFSVLRVFNRKLFYFV